MLKSFWEGIRTIGNSLQSPLLLIVRLFWGYQFALTGYGKLLHLDRIAAYFQSLEIPFPFANAVLASSVETIGGVLLFLGLFSRIAAIPLLGVMTTAYITAGRNTLVSLFTELDPHPFLQHVTFLFMFAALIIFCFGPGKISLDYWLSDAHKKKEMP